MERRLNRFASFARRAVSRENPGVLITIGVVAAVSIGFPWTELRGTHATSVMVNDLRPQFQKIALDGYCPVALRNQQAWKLGAYRFRTIYEGCIYQFSDADAQAAFTANPSQYSVVICGCDVVVAKDQSRLVDGKREHGLWYGGKTYLFANEDGLQRFMKTPQDYAAFETVHNVLLINRFINLGPDRDPETVPSDAIFQAVAR